MKTLFWHDYETWGIDPSTDKPAQFAGIRTDENLDIVGEPVRFYCQPPVDCLPHPEACLVTGITPQRALREGLPEYRFAAEIQRHFTVPGTCGVGYNSIRFDDEVSRYLFYRNFYDPYAREWQQGNSRWDVIDMVRTAYALRPEGVEWPTYEDGTPSFKLEHLTEANGFEHANAHDALADVYATIDIARLIQQQQPQLYDYAFRLRSKKAVAELIDWQHHKPLLHISSRYSNERGCAALVMPIAMHPTNANGVIVYDLSVPPDDLIQHSVELLQQQLFTPAADLPEGLSRVPLKVVHLNRAPMLLTPKLLDDATCERLSINRQQCEGHWHQLLVDCAAVAVKAQRVFADGENWPERDVEQQLYAGFLSDADRNLCVDVVNADPAVLRNRTFAFQDQRLTELLLRYKARNFPDALTAAEQAQWFEWVQGRLSNDDGLSLTRFKQRVQELAGGSGLSSEQQQVLVDLQAYGEELGQRYGLSTV